MTTLEKSTLFNKRQISTNMFNIFEQLIDPKCSARNANKAMATKISLDALIIIDAIDRRGSFAKAAEELNKATSALSYSVQKLEEQLDVTLFQRQGRKSVLTPSGKLLLDEGRKILSASSLLERKVKELSDGWETSIRIGIESTLDREKFFETLTGFADKHPSIEIDIKECVLGGGWEDIELDNIDLFVGGVEPIPQHKGLRTVRLGSVDMVLVAAAQHPISKLANGKSKKEKETLNAAILQSRRVITHDTANINVQRDAGLLTGKNDCYVQTIDQKITAIKQGIGIGHLPRLAIADLLKQGELIELAPQDIKNQRAGSNSAQSYIAWKISHRGNGIKILSELLINKLATTG